MDLKYIKVEQSVITLSNSINSMSKKESNATQDSLKVFLEVASKFLYSKEFGLPKSKIKSVQIDISICGDQKMRNINKDHRGKNKTTDVLSFPQFENLRDIESQEFFCPECHLGDIIISWPYTVKQAKEFKITNQMEFIHLLTHGFLHLCGYDHEISKSEEDLMFSLEDKLVKEIYKKVYG